MNKKKAWYYIDEFIVFFFSIISVILSDAVMKKASGKLVTIDDVFVDWINLVISGILAMASYGAMYTKWKYTDDKKPPLIKRISTSILQGIAWRTIIGWTK